MTPVTDNTKKQHADMPDFAFNFPEEIKAKFTGLIFSDGQISTPDGDCAFLEKNDKGLWQIKHLLNGKLLTLTSPNDPVAEDQALFKRFAPRKDEGVLCLGVGLGYLLEMLHEHLSPNTPLWLWESRPEILAAAFMARDLSNLWKRHDFQIFTGPEDAEKLLDNIDYAVFRPLARPNTMRFYAREYERKNKKIDINTKIRKHIKKALICQSGYFLDREIMNAAEELGLETMPWFFQREGSGTALAFHDFLETVKNFSPDLVITVNHLGFDSEGIMDEVFNNLRLPAASWFVDSPAVILSESREPAGDFVSIFCWDKDYINKLKFKNVFYLPLATDEKYFSPSINPVNFTRIISFVGDSLTHATGKYLAKLGISEKHLNLIDRMAFNFMASEEIFPNADELKKNARLISRQVNKVFLDNLSALVIWRASRFKRLEVLKAMPPEQLFIAGDKGWNSLLEIPIANLSKPLDYYNELCQFYQSSKINLNVTSAQMKNGLNQRVFDVPASGAFLLTDYRKQLEDLFEIDREVIVYRSAEEAAEKAQWYCLHDNEREKIIQAARARISKEHLYRHRLQKLVGSIRDAYY